MHEPSGPLAAQHSAEEATVQTAYSAFIKHTVACAKCRTEGMDCVDAGDLRQAYRAAKERAREVR